MLFIFVNEACQFAYIACSQYVYLCACGYIPEDVQNADNWRNAYNLP